MKTAEEVEQFLMQMDRRADTGDPDDDSDDTGDPDDVDAADPEDADTADPDTAGDDDTAAPPDQGALRRALLQIQGANGGRAPTTGQLTGLMTHMLKKGGVRRRYRMPP